MLHSKRELTLLARRLWGEGACELTSLMFSREAFLVASSLLRGTMKRGV